MLWIHTDFNADPEPAFKLNADPDLEPGGQPMRIHANSDRCQSLPSIKVEFLLDADLFHWFYVLVLFPEPVQVKPNYSDLNHVAK